MVPGPQTNGVLHVFERSGASRATVQPLDKTLKSNCVSHWVTRVKRVEWDKLRFISSRKAR